MADPEDARARARRRERVGQLAARGLTTRQIADALGVARATVSRDVRTLREAGHDVALPGMGPWTAKRTPFALARVAAGVSLGTLAARAGVTVTTVRRADRGARVHPDSAARLAVALGATVRDLWPDAPPPVAPYAPVVQPGDDDPAWRRRLRVAELLTADVPPGEVARRLDIGRATVYRDAGALREAGWTLPPRPMGRRPGKRGGKRDSGSPHARGSALDADPAPQGRGRRPGREA